MNVSGSVGPDDVMSLATSRKIGLDERVPGFAYGDAGPAADGQLVFSVTPWHLYIPNFAGWTAKTDGCLNKDTFITIPKRS